MVTYETFLQTGIDLAPLGAGAGERESDYFCTPLGASVIGWEGVDGVHCCFVEGFGETVFAVSPMNLPGEYVHPVARNFEDFLRLFLTCGHFAAMEQAWAWTHQGQFGRYLEENPPSPEQTAVLERLKADLGLTPLEEPFSYIKELQASFDYSKLSFGESCVEQPPETLQKLPPWRVKFEGNFWGRYGQGHAGKEIPRNVAFTWGGQPWLIPAIYLCTAGVVVDLCAQVEPERIRAFVEKWEALDGNGLSSEDRELLQAENPTSIDISPSATLCGKPLRQKHGCCTVWVPPSCMPEGERCDPAADWVLEHYGLDRSQGWVIWRTALGWFTRRKPKDTSSFVLHLARDRQAVPGPRFTAEAGRRVAFVHPVTGAEHVLTVLAREEEELDAKHFRDGDLEYPTHCEVLRFTITPELPQEAVRVQDCSSGDSPRRKNGSPSGAFAATVIGGASGPVAFVAGSPAQTAVSSLYFQKPEAVEWRVVFYQKPVEDIDVPFPLE